MNEVREIVTRAVLAKGRKIFKLTEVIPVSCEAYSVLGCWIINHEYSAKQNGRSVDVDGSFEINIWYSGYNNTKTEIARQTISYSGNIKTREIVADNISNDCDVIARVLQQPTCTNAVICADGISVDVCFEIIVEVIGETKMMVTVFNCPVDNEPFDDFENEINENFINEG